MKKPGKFANSPFHREGRTGEKASLQPQNPQSPKDEFFSELVKTGRPNWKKAPSAVKQRYNGIFMILFSIPIMALSGWELYRRMEGKSTKKVQEGEIIQGKEVRKFDEAEKWQREKDSLLFKILVVISSWMASPVKLWNSKHTRIKEMIPHFHAFW
ncbi:hypothetical protein CJJ09_005602 [Candidozyma auris]|nr:hypothetical protein CJJ09_005602 [[Candida] auris]